MKKQYVTLDGLYEITSKDFLYPTGWKAMLGKFVIDETGTLYKRAKDGSLTEVQCTTDNGVYKSYQLCVNKNRFNIRVHNELVANKFGQVAKATASPNVETAKKPIPEPKAKSVYAWVMVDTSDDTVIEGKTGFKTMEEAAADAEESVIACSDQDVVTKIMVETNSVIRVSARVEKA